MSKIVTIPSYMNPFQVTVNGIPYRYESGATVEVPDEVAAVIENQIALNKEPKEKLGKSQLVVTHQEKLASHTAAEIWAHVQGGGTAVLYDDEYYTDQDGKVAAAYLALQCVTEKRAYFAGVTYVNGRFIHKVYVLNANGTIFAQDLQYQLLEFVEFTIDGNAYKAAVGMTWNEWIDSAWNTDEVQIDNEGYVSVLSGDIVGDAIGPVQPTEEIQNGYDYRLW